MKRKTRVKLGRFRRTVKKISIRLAGIATGAALIAISINVFIIPYGLLSGGVSGLSLILNYLTGFPVYLGIFLINLPIFIWGLKELNREFIIYSAAGTIVLILVLPLSKPYIPVFELDLFLASLFSGVVTGLGSGIVLKYGASTGGTDIISMIAKKKKNISVGATTFYCNIAVLFPSLYFFDLKIAMYTAISMWVGGKVTDAVIEGFNHNKSVMIISDKSSEIADRILHDMHRGVTYLEGQGAYSGQPKQVISCVVSHYEIPRLNEIVHSIDKKAFIYVTETVEVRGRGFTW